MQMHVINPLFLEKWSRSYNFSVFKKLLTWKRNTPDFKFQPGKLNIELSQYGVMLILSLFPLQ